MPAIEGYAHLAQDPDYNGGAPRVAAAGVRVYTIWTRYEHGDTPKEISEDYERLTLAAVFSALAYAADHPEELEAYRREEAESTNELIKNSSAARLLRIANERASVLS